MIRLEHATKLYRTVIGVNDLDLELAAGTYGLIGPNGSGKTTLINLLTGNLRPSLGKVYLFGADPWRERRVLREVGLCPASDLLSPHVTPLEWVTYLTSLHGIHSLEARRMAEDALQQVGMAAAIHERMRGFSLGMRQRVKLAQAIAHRPKLLILDEPFNGLDPIGRHEMTSFLKQWGADGRSLILASHILHEVEAVTQSFLLIHGGRILASGAANEVQAMLQGYPQEIWISGRGLRSLAQRLMEYDWVESVAFEAGGAMCVSVEQPLELYQFLLQTLADSPACTIERLHSSDGSLSAAFEALLKRHRGDH
jgi:ABC-2 type transport system ATP-binding protein